MNATTETADPLAICAALVDVNRRTTLTPDTPLMFAARSFVAFPTVAETVETPVIATVLLRIISRLAVAADAEAMAAVRWTALPVVAATVDADAMAAERLSVRVVVAVTVDADVIAALRSKLPETLAAAVTVDAEVIAALAWYVTTSDTVRVWPTCIVPEMEGGAPNDTSPLVVLVQFALTLLTELIAA